MFHPYAQIYGFVKEPTDSESRAADLPVEQGVV